MDLFGDLPEPNAEKETEEEVKSEMQVFKKQAEVSLFDDLPAESTPTCAPEVKVLSNGSKVDDPEARGQKRKAEEESQQAQKITAKGLSSLVGYAAGRKGEREEMQDAHVIMDDFTHQFSCLSPKISRLAYYGVYDGHGGKRASLYTADNLHNNIADKFPKGDVLNMEKEIKKCLIEAFKKTDEEFLKEASKHKPVWKDGTTAVSILVVDDVMYIANLGDSKAILCRRKEDGSLTGVPLTNDHSPVQYEERQRIQKAGGSVREGRVLGVLEVSRSIGDGQYKRCGVINTPDVKRCQLTQDDRFLLLACDGLWKAFSVSEAIQYVSEVLQDETILATEFHSAEEVRFDTACSKLASEAVLRGSSDNVTVLLVSVKKS
ncbi:PREDICTED: integrin-linked kinase-associated serine/threonine phosphatase 2C-like [Branchiostoma belcheri]|uniref:Integrin-linked kinase-associated serine/threonine phosphatase 2C n=1 Tax=Branchiostoma belcheri TaxID=7741 RepID=A0A6P4ZEI0_BRABE|nr:PREDICTED: integrin-linked kinase-associated serine/threonine phosphatase 2C-like [Branchiostoma belcheri]